MTPEEAYEIRRAAKSHLARTCAIQALLVTKGICTEEELEAMRIAALAQIDQQVAAMGFGEDKT